MKKTELKKVLKPLIKECVKEVMFEQGILSGIISEVVKGLGASTIVESKEEEVVQPPPRRDNKEIEKKLHETKQQMLEAIGKSSYGGVDIFENTQPLAKGGAATSNASSQGPLRDMDPTDPGVDISGIMNLAGGGWKQI
jgi:hypothetical protein